MPSWREARLVACNVLLVITTWAYTRVKRSLGRTRVEHDKSVELHTSVSR